MKAIGNIVKKVWPYIVEYKLWFGLYLTLCITVGMVYPGLRLYFRPGFLADYLLLLAVHGIPGTTFVFYAVRGAKKNKEANNHDS